MRSLLEDDKITTIREVESQSSALRVLLVQQLDDIQRVADRERHHMPQPLRTHIEATVDECKVEVDTLRKSLDVLDVLIRREHDATLTKLQLKLTRTQIEESRKAIKQASTVTRLTILAFIYIPTSCVCGFFGMNVVGVPDGFFDITTFAVTIVVVLATTLCLAFANRIMWFSRRLWWRLLDSPATLPLIRGLLSMLDSNTVVQSLMPVSIYLRLHWWARNRVTGVPRNPGIDATDEV
ncbi:uncharacterized protein AB675_2583 [Cyphellophora attinorum]|uniref:Magnesium transport protein CorA n=1 Tax=Cyphellophora attinorum TaxID=1664694 RepID=A0A0N1HAK3_9EURO|nr:uncharacterized protein AB675_2583 [Phialophora attinorum]KPI45042.1 hypothetical protein AB675_2583 [Phialophora attinorum]